jgi:hypothetical protein
MAFPGPKVHRTNRRKLGRGQTLPIAPVVCTVTGTSSTATLTFSAPVIVSGPIPLSVVGLTPVTQTVTSSTVVTILFSAALGSAAWSLPGGAANVATYQGGGVAPASGTF